MNVVSTGSRPPCRLHEWSYYLIAPYSSRCSGWHVVCCPILSHTRPSSSPSLPSRGSTNTCVHLCPFLSLRECEEAVWSVRLNVEKVTAAIKAVLYCTWSRPTEPENFHTTLVLCVRDASGLAPVRDVVLDVDMMGSYADNTEKYRVLSAIAASVGLMLSSPLAKVRLAPLLKMKMQSGRSAAQTVRMLCSLCSSARVCLGLWFELAPVRTYPTRHPLRHSPSTICNNPVLRGKETFDPSLKTSTFFVYQFCLCI